MLTASVLLLALSSYSACLAQTQPPAPRGLLQLVAWGGADIPGWLLLDQSFREELANGYPGPIDFYTEYLDAARFSGAEYEARLAELLQEKNHGRIDLVAAFGVPALAFALRHRQTIWPGVPVVFSLVEQQDIDQLGSGPGVTGVTTLVNPRGTLEAALAVQPDTRQVFVISGTLPFDSLRLARAWGDLEAYRDRVQFTYLNDLPMAELQKRLGRLPPHSIVLVLHLFRDGAGRVFRPYDSFRLIARASNVPVYGVLDTYLNAGMVGGDVSRFQDQGRIAGELASRILLGESADTLAIRSPGTMPVYDWRELNRWGLKESSVVPGAAVYFREPGIWAQYRWYIVGTLLILALQTALIAALLVQRSARQEAQRSLEERVQFLRLIVELSSSSLGLSAAQVDRWLGDWLRQLGTSLGVDRATLVEENQGVLHLAHGWSADSLPPLPPVSVNEFPWVTGMLQRGQSVRVGRLANLPPEAATDRDTLQRYGVKSFLATPLIERGRTIGMLSLAAHQGERTWPEEVLTRLRLIGDLLASALVIRRTETARQASEQLSRTLLGVLSCPAAVLDREGNILRVNPAWGHVAPGDGPPSYPWAPVGGNYLVVCRRTTEVGGGSFAPAVVEGIQSVLSGRAAEFRMRYHRSSPTGHHPMELLVAPLNRPEGGALVSHVDLSDLERSEGQIQELRQTVAHLGRVANMGELSASLAHELNQPLTAILHNVQAARRFLSREPFDLTEIREILNDIEDDDRRAGEVISRLRTMIRKGHPDKRAFFLHNLAREVADLLSSDALIRRVAVVLELDDTLPPVWGDRIQISQVVLNLMMNGADAMDQSEPGNHKLLLRVWRYDEQSVALSVQDRGTGITVSPVDRIFEPFYTSKRDGMGLGLSICRSIVEAHRGRIWASNNPDRGATIHVVLPIGREGPG